MKKTVILACLLAIVISMLALTGCGSSGGSSSEAAVAAKSFFSAYETNDANVTWDLLSTASKKQVKKEDWAAFMKEAEKVTFKVGEVKVTGDTATAEVAATSQGKTETETVPLVKEADGWKVDMAGVKNE